MRTVARALVTLATLGTIFTGTPTAAQHQIPECTIQAVVGSDFTQIDVAWPDTSEVTEYAYRSQWQAAQKISDIETEFACDVRWERA